MSSNEAKITEFSSLLALQAHLAVLKVTDTAHYLTRNPRHKPGKWLYRVVSFPKLTDAALQAATAELR